MRITSVWSVLMANVAPSAKRKYISDLSPKMSTVQTGFCYAMSTEQDPSDLATCLINEKDEINK